MPIKDIFKYSARWDSVGLDCAYCTHQKSGIVWPDVNHKYGCVLHQCLLAVELASSGFKEGEWFCKYFENSGSASPDAVKTFERVKDVLDENILYGLYGEDGFLKEVPFGTLAKFNS